MTIDMTRGELWTVSGGRGFAGKPRPALVIQDDAYRETRSVTVCLATSNEAEATVSRPVVHPDANNGLRKPSRIMIDKVSTLPRSRLGKRIGALSADDMTRIDRSLLVFLGLAA